jgi:hypothetical protein
VINYIIIILILDASFSTLLAQSSSPVSAVPPTFPNAFLQLYDPPSPTMPSTYGLIRPTQPSAGQRLRTMQMEHSTTVRSQDPSAQVPAPSPGPQTPGTPSFGMSMSLSAINRANQLFETVDDATSRGTGNNFDKCSTSIE